MGSGCCQCKWGSNLILWQSRDICGPWSRSVDINPVSNSSSRAWCRHAAVDGQLNAIGVLRKEGGGNDSVILALIDRWMTGPGANPDQNTTGCSVASNAKNSEAYVHGDDAQYWVPLSFSANGTVLPLRPFQASIRVNLATTNVKKEMSHKSDDGSASLSLPLSSSSSMSKREVALFLCCDFAPADADRAAGRTMEIDLWRT